MMSARVRRGPAHSVKGRSLVLAGILALVTATYFLLPQSWFEIPADEPAPGGTPNAVPAAHAQHMPAATPASMEQLADAARRVPNDFTARSRYGMSLAAAGRSREALAEFLAAERLAPESPTVHHNLGIHYLNSRQPRKAEEAFCRELEVAPGDGLAHYFRGQALQAQGRLEQALAQYRLASALAPAMPDAYLAQAVLLAEKHPPAETRKLVDRFIELGGDAAAGYFVLSRAHRAKREHAEAARYAEMTVQKSPGSYSYWQNLGLIYYRGRRFGDAETALLRAVELIQNPVNSYIYLGMNAQEAGRFDDAIGFFRKALSADPGVYNVHLYLARAYERAGDVQSARNEEMRFRALEREHQRTKRHTEKQ